MKRLYFDTETTGTVPKAPTPLGQMPHIVQIAAILVDDKLGELANLNCIIQPDHWSVPAGAAAIHGITTDCAIAFGVPIKSALSLFSSLLAVSDQLIAHNIAFDTRVYAAEITRLAQRNRACDLPNICTMLLCEPICKIPGNSGKFKWPKLEEAYSFFFNEPIVNAHDALADVRACQRIHQHLLTNNLA